MGSSRPTFAGWTQVQFAKSAESTIAEYMRSMGMIVEQTSEALGAILNLSRFKPAATLEEANARLYLIDQIALQALGDFKKTAFTKAGLSRRRAPPMENRERSRDDRSSQWPAQRRQMP